MLSRNPAKMVIEIKGLDGIRLDQKCMNESGHTILLTKSPDKNYSIVHPIQFFIQSMAATSYSFT